MSLLIDGDVALDALFERDKCLCCHYAGYALQLLVDEVHELFVVFGEELHHHGVRACGEVAFYHLGYVFELFDHTFVHVATLGF